MFVCVCVLACLVLFMHNISLCFYGFMRFMCILQVFQINQVIKDSVGEVV